ncbi:hypothetical protein CBS101457_000209 [Exobasidium rhododendri]|nr:hypothetical protein CBS101457_000209 [Exobasidium rhododendri]
MNTWHNDHSYHSHRQAQSIPVGTPRPTTFESHSSPAPPLASTPEWLDALLPDILDQDSSGTSSLNLLSSPDHQFQYAPLESQHNPHRECFSRSGDSETLTPDMSPAQVIQAPSDSPVRVTSGHHFGTPYDRYLSPLAQRAGVLHHYSMSKQDNNVASPPVAGHLKTGSHSAAAGKGKTFRSSPLESVSTHDTSTLHRCAFVESSQWPPQEAAAYQSSPRLNASSPSYFYTVPWEYTVPNSARFPDDGPDNLHDKVYLRLTEDQREFVADYVQQIRPYSPESVRKYLTRHLTGFLAKELLSNDVLRMDAAVHMILPINQPKQRTLRDPWMTGFTDEQRRFIIKKFAEATKQRSDRLLGLFLKRVSPALAFKILTVSMKECATIAAQYGLYLPFDAKEPPWQRGISSSQRRALLDRMMRTPEMQNLQMCRYHLRKVKASFFGLMMLRASDEKFAKIVSSMKERN